MSKKVIKKQKAKSSSGEVMALIMGMFALAVLCGLPLVVTDMYFNILETKYIYFCICSITMFSAAVFYGVSNGKIAEYLKTVSIKEQIKKFSAADWAMLLFWASNVISWILCSDWRYEAFWGTSGRYNGVFLMTLYMITYFMMTRFFVFRKWYLDAFLAVGLFVCIFGITDYFQMDIFGFKVKMAEYQVAIYTSTLGNINTYTVYAAAVMIVAMLLFADEDKPKKLLWYYINMVVAAFALIMGCSDNAYLSLAALFGLSPLYLFRTKKGVSRYLISFATFFTVILCISGINNVFADQVIGIDSAFTLIAGLKFLPLLVAALWLLAGGVTYLWKQDMKNGKAAELGKGLWYFWIAVIVLVVGGAAFAFYDATIAGNSERYGALASYVTFNESWGTDRGYVWTAAMDIWKNKLNFLQKIFGYGADTFRLLMMYFYEPRYANGRAVVYDSVHNEYLNYLLTIGVVGMFSYITFLAGAVVRMCKRLKGHPEVAAAMFVVIAYAVQALININLPIVMPVILLLLTMGLGKLPDEMEK